MTRVDFDSLRTKRKPTRREAARYRRWVKYLKDSRLGDNEIHRRAASLTQQGKDP